MKNIQVIDGAQNCTYDIYSVTDEKFQLIFSLDGQDVEFIEDLKNRMNEKELESVFHGFWDNLISKDKVRGIHGTLFYELLEKKKFYPTKKESEMISFIEANIS